MSKEQEAELSQEAMSMPEDTTLFADMSEGQAEAVPIKVNPGVLSRLEETLNKRGLTTREVGTGLVIVGLAIGAGFATKKFIDQRREKRHLSDDEFDVFKGKVDENYEDIFNYLRFGLKGQTQDVEDLTQRVFMRALDKYPAFKPNDKLENPERSWFFRIAHNLLANHYRDEGKRMNRTTDIIIGEDEDEKEINLIDPVLRGAHSLESEIEFEADPDIVRAREVINGLPDDAKLLLYLKHAENFANNDIGYVLGRSEGAIKSYYHRTLKRFRDEFDEE